MVGTTTCSCHILALLRIGLGLEIARLGSETTAHTGQFAHQTDEISWTLGTTPSNAEEAPRAISSTASVDADTLLSVLQCYIDFVDLGLGEGIGSFTYDTVNEVHSTKLGMSDIVFEKGV